MTLLQSSILLRTMIARSFVFGLIGCSAFAAQETVRVTEISPEVLVFATTAGNVVASVGPDGALLVGTRRRQARPISAASLRVGLNRPPATWLSGHRTRLIPRLTPDGDGAALSLPCMSMRSTV